MKTPTKNIMRKFRMGEISGVDKPAQAGALVSLMKRAEPNDTDAKALQKRAGLTSAVQGHSHLVVVNYEGNYDGGGANLVSGNTSWAADHSHPWVMDASGGIVIGEAMGHTHTLDTLGISQAAAWEFLSKSLVEVEEVKTQTLEKEAPMDAEAKKKEDDKKAVDALAALTKQVDLLTALNQLTDVEKAHYKSLAEADATVFLAKSADERGTIMKALEVAKSEADPVVFKSASGEVFRKSDDPRLVTMAKSMDADRLELAKSRAATENAKHETFAKGEMGHLPGTIEVRTAISKAVHGIADETIRTEALSVLKAQNAKLAPLFKTLGGTGQEGEGAADKDAADAELDTLAKSIAAKEGINYYDAYEKAGQQKPDLLKRAILG